ncbi:GAF and ANTAR domain-containing protein [Streptomyces sp. NPDC059944]|uniref:GAF and ANTAR domain-containing protein n=1 Tax=unclassified Streptomyces TaxID=2593676 RepID=UPI00362BA2E9
MNREQQMTRAFVGLADTYAPEFDPLHLFNTLVLACREILAVDAAAVMIADARGGLRTMAATEEGAAFIELLQMQTGRGPCMDCYRTGETISIPDITAEQERWPYLVTGMAEAGFRALQTIPVSLHDRHLGALTLLNTSTGALRRNDVRLARALADTAALSLMHWSTEPTRSDDVITRVQSAIAAKTALEIAKGMIAEYAGVDVAEAGRRLTDYASRRRVSLAATAQALARRALDPTDILGEYSAS